MAVPVYEVSFHSPNGCSPPNVYLWQRGWSAMPSSFPLPAFVLSAELPFWTLAVDILCVRFQENLWLSLFLENPQVKRVTSHQFPPPPPKTLIWDIFPTGWVQLKLLGVIWGLFLWTQHCCLWKVNTSGGNICLALSHWGCLLSLGYESLCRPEQVPSFSSFLSFLEGDVTGLSSLQHY